MTTIDKGCFERGCACYDTRIDKDGVRVVNVEQLLAGVGELTDKHDHPEPHTMKWTQLEMDYINNRVAAAVAIEREWLRKCLLVMEREAKWAFDDLNEEPDVLNADIAALKEHLK